LVAVVSAVVDVVSAVVDVVSAVVAVASSSLPQPAIPSANNTGMSRIRGRRNRLENSVIRSSYQRCALLLASEGGQIYKEIAVPARCGPVCAAAA